jgi:cytochrome c oxidase accessory protein FixG
MTARKQDVADNSPERIDAVTVQDDLDSRVHNLYEKREKIFTRSIEGFYQNIRLFTGWPLLLGYFLLPWLTLDDRPAILFDLPARQFHILWLTFWPQDFGYLYWGLMIAAFLLFFITTLLGRVWCGYTCPQTVWTAIFMWAEQVAEGVRHQRINLEQAPWSLQKLAKRVLKHGMWMGFAALTGITFVAYFYDVRELLVDAYLWRLSEEAVFWVGFFTLATYINAGWMREQVCLYMCPYARFQSAMFDKDTLIVSYDASRGEARGPRKRRVEPATLGLGDCIDCSLCVQVCPPGIDIRDGLQYECINCAYCIDACDAIMGRMGYDAGLIAYTTEHQQAGLGWTWKRPKLLGYGMAVMVMMSLFGYSLYSRVPLGLDVMRNRGELYQEVPGGLIRNTYSVKILNMGRQDHEMLLAVSGLPEPRLVPDDIVWVRAGEIYELSVDVLVDPDLLSAVNTTIEFEVTTVDQQWQADSESRYLGPLPVGTY